MARTVRMDAESEATLAGIEARTLAVLGGLGAYLAVMYAFVLRAYFSLPVVLMPWLLKQPGYRLYETVYIPYMPGYVWFNMAAHAIIPAPMLRVRLLMILVVLASMAIIFVLGRRWFGPPGGVVGAVLFAAWTPVLMDRPMYMEVMVGFLTLVAILVWHRMDSNEVTVKLWQPLVAGLLIGYAVLVKQQAVAVAGSYVIWRVLGMVAGREWRHGLRDLALFLGGFLILPLGTLAVLQLEGRFDAFLYWTWQYALDNPFETRGVLASGLDEVVLLAAWLGLVPVFAFFVIPKRESWRGPAILLLGQVVPLLSPLYPRYGRFHLSGAVPIIALIGAGAVVMLLAVIRENRGWQHWAGRIVLGGAALITVVAFLLPSYYRVRLGPRVGEWGPLLPVSAWLMDETDLASGQRVWVLPATDPTDNFHAIEGTLPPTLWVQTYPWFQSLPGVTDELLTALEEDPPPYAVMFERWRGDIPEPLLAHLDAHYIPIGETTAPDEYGRVTFYRLAE